MKKILTLILALTMVFCLCACGGTEEDSKSDDGKKTNSASSNEETKEGKTEDTKPQVVKYTVYVVDEEGDPVEDVRVYFEDGDPETAPNGTWTPADGTVTLQAFEQEYTVTVEDLPEGFAEDTTEYTFEDGSYELTITLKAE